ncbi:fucose permease [Propionicimonas paludicola]|uniref:Fucose permease n=1 Tax=Propionicimonas paludicola TaxID=185243 RepID=A0A2A9CNV4_9ACTN|nr:MFS transporter [Propionicimonas paludicola]PFG16018.1 fucose permease [Propionicimonas paludicola]
MLRPAATTTPQRARLLLIAAFAITGIVAFSWMARIPSVMSALGLTAPQFGAVLLVGSVGSVVTVVASGGLLNRFGTVRLFAFGTVINALGIALMGVGPALASVWVFTAGIIISGIGGALLNVSVNLESTRIEQALGRTVIPHFHAGFSIGAVLGSLIGAGASSLSIPVGTQFIAIAVLSGGLRLAALRTGLVLPGRSLAAHTDGRWHVKLRAELSAWTERRTMQIALVAFVAAFSEGVANNWLTVSFVQDFAEPEAIAGLALGVFIGAMTLLRVFGSRLIDWLGRARTLQLSLIASVVGLALFGLASSAGLAVVGTALWGLGAALCFPIAVAAASDEPSLAAGRVSVVASMGSIAALVAAPMVGFIAAALGAQHSMLVVLIGLLLALMVSPRVDPPTVGLPLDQPLSRS